MPNQTPYRVLDEDQFEAEFRPQDATDGGFYHEHKAVKDLDEHLVWSAVDSEDGDVVLCPGFHVVNVFAYVRTEVPWKDGDIVECVLPGVGEDLDDEGADPAPYGHCPTSQVALDEDGWCSEHGNDCGDVTLFLRGERDAGR